MTATLFFRHLSDDDKGEALLGAISSVGAGDEACDVHSVSSESFRLVPGSPFAYWAGQLVRELFVSLPAVAAKAQAVQHGASTKDDFRFLRTCWEASPQKVLDAQFGPYGNLTEFEEWCKQRTFEGKDWIVFSKGGEFMRYYADPHLVLNWENNGDLLEQTLLAKYPYLGDSANWVLHRECKYFHPGITWSARSQVGLSMRALPSGCMFASKGPTVFAPASELLALLGILNSGTFSYLVELQMAFGSYEVGVIERTPVPDNIQTEGESLNRAVLKSVLVNRELDSATETSHAFNLPTVLQASGGSIAERVKSREHFVAKMGNAIRQAQDEIDSITQTLYRATANRVPQGLSVQGQNCLNSVDTEILVDELLSYVIGSVFGRWDIRVALDRSLAPELQGPFDPLPVCSPGMLAGVDGLPARRGGTVSEEWLRARPNAITLPEEGSVSQPTIPDSGYPLRLDWDGIIVDDEGHPDDIVARIRDVFQLIWDDQAGEIEREACEYLGVSNLREYVRNPRKFWDAHVKRYSKSRRKAPIYWLLQSSKRNYGVWLYYHRMDADILYKVLRNYVDPKINRETNRLEEMRLALPDALGAGGRTARQAQKAVEDQEALIAEVEAFRATLERVALLGLTVDHDDGVLLSIAPLHELVPWKPAKGAWDELVAGKYEWSTMSKQMREKGLVRERGSRR